MLGQSALGSAIGLTAGAVGSLAVATLLLRALDPRERSAFGADLLRTSDVLLVAGRFELFIDGSSVSVLTSLDNNLSAVDFVRLGALSVKPGASGTLYWDEFESRRGSRVGP